MNIMNKLTSTVASYTIPITVYNQNSQTYAAIIPR